MARLDERIRHLEDRTPKVSPAEKTRAAKQEAFEQCFDALISAVRPMHPENESVVEKTRLLAERLKAGRPTDQDRSVLSMFPAAALGATGHPDPAEFVVFLADVSDSY